MGSDAAEFVKKVKDQVRNRQKRMSRRVRWRTFNNMENVHGYNVKCGDIHGKEFLNYSKCCQDEDLTLMQMFDVTAQLLINQGRNQWPGKNSVGKVFSDTFVTDWWWNSHQSPTHKSLCLLGFCVVPRKSSSTSQFQRSLEEQSCGSTSREKLQRLWCCQWRDDWIRVERFPRIHNVAALW